MDLILWRHADALPAGEGPDSARKLTGKGRKQASQMADWLDRRLPDGARLYSSGATRAIETAEALSRLSGRKLVVKAELGLGADPVSLLAVSGWPQNRHAVVLVGHQPTLGRLASYMLWGESGDMALRKGAVCWLSNRHRPHGQAADESDQSLTSARPVLLRALVCPDLL